MSGVPPGNDHAQAVGLLSVESIKLMQVVSHMRVSLAEKFGIGSTQLMKQRFISSVVLKHGPTGSSVVIVRVTQPATVSAGDGV